MFQTIIVDDEDIAIVKFRHLLTREKRLNLVQAFTGAYDALDYLKDHTVDVAFLDIQMPEIDGLVLAERILEIEPNITIVFLTAYDSYALEAFRAHAMGYLLKPLSQKELTSLVDVLEKRISPFAERKTETKVVAKLMVETFGTFRCYSSLSPDSSITFRTSKTVELFLFLLIRRGSSVTKEYLLEALFPDADYEKANKLFYVSCSYLRSTFAQNGFPSLLIRENESYRFDVSAVECDYLRFIKICEKMKDCDMVELIEANDIYVGEFLMGRPYDWLFETQSYLENLHSKLMFELVKKYLEHGERLKAYQVLETFLSFNPCNEDVVEKIILMKLEDGQTNAARSVLKTYAQILDEQYAATPSAHLKSLIK